MKIDCFPKEAFESFLDNKNNSTDLNSSYRMNCLDCKNYWLIKGEGKENQAKILYVNMIF